MTMHLLMHETLISSFNDHTNQKVSCSKSKKEQHKRRGLCNNVQHDDASSVQHLTSRAYSNHLRGTGACISWQDHVILFQCYYAHVCDWSAKCSKSEALKRLSRKRLHLCKLFLAAVRSYIEHEPHLAPSVTLFISPYMCSDCLK
jgi:hypothetical protein